MHRDIKPENIVLDEHEDIVLIDFGNAQQFKGNDDTVSGTQGTILYFAPEMVGVGAQAK